MINKISTGNYDVIESNTVYLFEKNNDFNLSFKFKNFKFMMKIIFRDNLEKKEQQLLSRINGDTVEFTCINFRNEFGTGTPEPIEIATIESKKVYIHFWVFAHGDMQKDIFVRKVEYTVFRER